MERNYINKTEKDLFDHWQKEINIEDNRSKAMPTVRKGTVIGVKEGEVLIRVNNNVTNWYSLKRDDLNFFI